MVPSCLDPAVANQILISLIAFAKKNTGRQRETAFAAMENVLKHMHGEKYARLVFSQIATSELAEGLLSMERTPGSLSPVAADPGSCRCLGLVAVIARCLRLSNEVATRFAKLVSFEKIVFAASQATSFELRLNFFKIIVSLIRLKFKSSYFEPYIVVL